MPTPDDDACNWPEGEAVIPSSLVPPGRRSVPPGSASALTLGRACAVISGQMSCRAGDDFDRQLAAAAAVDVAGAAGA